MNSLVTVYDASTDLRKRSRKHNRPSAIADEKSMADDLHALHPFSKQSGREHSHFKSVKCSMLGHLDYNNFLQWTRRRATVHYTSLGN
jgi:hypothetical protein